MSLTINILVKDNEATIEETLSRASSLSKSILIGDIGSHDRTIDICKKFNAKVIQVPFRKDYSESKNYMIERNDSWIMFLEPYEAIISAPVELGDFLNDEKVAYRIKSIRNDLVTKEVRIWHKSSSIKFKNPVFESAYYKGMIKNIEIFTSPGNDYINQEKIDILNDWKAMNPTHNEPLYYHSCVNLIQKKWKNFVNSAETYLYKNNDNDTPSLMTRYYLSMVRSYVDIERNYEESIKNILLCIAEKPLMAEFWCLLGDIYYKIGDYSKSKSFYENAMILGSKRTEEDDLPIEISKYKNYPLKMIKACESIKSSTHSYKAKS